MAKKRTVLSLFCGAGGKTQGAIDAGYEPIGAIDNWMPAINAYRRNVSGDAWCRNLLHCDPKTFDKPDLLMASPPCPSFSIARTGGKETFRDQWLSAKVAEFAAVLKPAAVFVENVPPYEQSKSCKFLIVNLVSLGYVVQCQVLNAADFGAAQSRRRLIILAVNPAKAKIDPIVPTHSRSGADSLTKWQGWREAISDILPELRPDRLNAVQVKAIHEGWQDLLVQRTGYRTKPTIWVGSQPCGTLLASAGTDGKGNKRAKFLDVVLAEDNDHVPKWCRTINGRALQRLQGYPDGWDLGEDIREVARLVGNGVIPIVAQKVIESISYLH